MSRTLNSYRAFVIVRRIVVFVVFSFAFAACGGSEETTPKPKPAPEATVTVTALPDDSAATADECDKLSPKKASTPDDIRSALDADFMLLCLNEESYAAFADELGDRASRLLAPLRRTALTGGSPEAVLRELVTLGCAHSLYDFVFWRQAQELYGDLSSMPDRFLVRKWPETFGEALARDCF